MNIVYAAGSPLAGVCELMAGCVNQYFPQHHARVLSRGPGKHAWYCRQEMKVPRFNVRNKQHIRECVEWADVIHCMANVGARNLNMGKHLKSKVWVFQWHGCEQKGCLARSFSEEDYPYVKWIHIGQGWVERQKDFFAQFDKYGFQVVPNVISADDPIHRPVPWNRRTPGLVAFSPSNMKPGAINDKGIPAVKRACKDRHKLDMIFSCAFDECMKRKQKAVVGIDEVVTPMYHRSGLEFLAQGTPCICFYDEFTEAILTRAIGSAEMPFIHATRNNLREVLDTYMGKSEEEKKKMGEYSRKWIERYYHPRDLLLRYFEVYNS